MIIGRVRNVRVLVRSVRDTEIADVKRYIKSFTTTGYDWAHGMIKVTEDFTQDNDREFEPLVVGEDGVLEDKSDRHYVTVDGHHRQTALVTVLERDLPNASETCRYALVQRRDGKPMTETEVLSLGLDSNESTVQSKLMDTADVVVFLTHWVRGKHNERRLKHLAGLKLGVTKTGDLLNELLKEKIGGLCKDDGTMAYGVASMRRMLNIGLLGLEDSASTRYMVEKLKASKVKDGSDGSFALDTLISPIMLYAESIYTDKEAVRLRLLKMAWEYTCHRTPDKKVRRLVAGSDGSFYASAVLFIKYVQDATLKVVKQKGGTPSGVRSLWSGKGKQPAGSPARPSAVPAVPAEQTAPASDEASAQAATIHASTGSLDLLQQTRPGATMTLGDELTDLFVKHYTEAGNEAPKAGQSVSKLVLAMQYPFVLKYLPSWKKMVDEFIAPPPPPPPPPAKKKPSKKKQSKKGGGKSKSKKGKKSTTGGDAGASTGDAPCHPDAGAPPSGGVSPGTGLEAQPGAAGAAGAHGGGDAQTVKDASGGGEGDGVKDKEAGEAGTADSVGDGGKGGDDGTGKDPRKRKRHSGVGGEKRRSKRSRHPPPELGELVAVPTDQQLRAQLVRGMSVRAKSPFARAVRRVFVNGRRQGRHDIRNQVAEKPYDDTVPPIVESLHERAAANRRKLLEPHFGAPGVPPPPDPPLHVRLPRFAALLPTEHQGRDVLPGDAWKDIDKCVSLFMAQQGVKLLTGMPGVPTSLPDDDSGVHSLLGGAACLAFAKTLVECGWVIIENAVQDGMPRLLQGGPSSVDAVLDHYVHLFPGEAEVAKAAASPGTRTTPSVWAPIHNVDTDLDKVHLADGQGRFSVPVKMVASSDDATQSFVFIRKLHADACMAAIANKILEAVPAAEGRSSAPPVVRTPKTGARLLLTTENAVRQRPHIDSGLLEDKLQQEEIKSVEDAGGSFTGADKIEPTEDNEVQFVSAKKYKMPLSKSFFIMASGRDSFVLAVWPGSVLALRRIEDGHVVDRTLVSEVIEVPKNSILLCRSDLVHAGCGADEDTTRLNKAPVELAYARSIRLHMYLQHPHQALKDAIFPVSRVTFASNASPSLSAVPAVDGADAPTSRDGKAGAAADKPSSLPDENEDVDMSDVVGGEVESSEESSSSYEVSEDETDVKAADDKGQDAKESDAMEEDGGDDNDDVGSAKDTSVNGEDEEDDGGSNVGGDGEDSEGKDA
ncbi:hypothetical protein I4F81_005273 [Pyropia yezoensis]|uniref:Uncharacterized protein n=1 Tax=Pyropia yezoensis TaxID=2788 RepID=A0ACC3BYD0_PYRYE|nr:hypothetical protein I4F81_005273 [Neopyropia yezoensis]